MSIGHWSDLHHPVLLSLNAPEQHVGEEAACTGPGMSRGGCRQGGSRTGRSVRPSAEALRCALMGREDFRRGRGGQGLAFPEEQRHSSTY